MKRILLVLTLAVVAVTASDGARQNFFRVKCCHGCGSYYCNHTNCGDSCKMGPNCRGCWKDCANGLRALP
jgi:hypothetical protein